MPGARQGGLGPAGRGRPWVGQGIGLRHLCSLRTKQVPPGKKHVCSVLLKLRICFLSDHRLSPGLSCASCAHAAGFLTPMASCGLPLAALMEGGDLPAGAGVPPAGRALRTWGFPHTWSSSLVCPGDRLTCSLSQRIRGRLLEAGRPGRTPGFRGSAGGRRLRPGACAS